MTSQNLTLTSTANPFPTQLNGTTVTFNGIAAPILYLSPTQINAQVPSALQGSLTADVVVTTVKGASNTVTISDGKAMGIFTQGSAGCGQIAAFNIHADGSIAVNTLQNSLDPQTDLGLSIFLTGIGPFRDRKDGIPWQFNPGDQAIARFLKRRMTTTIAPAKRKATYEYALIMWPPEEGDPVQEIPMTRTEHALLKEHLPIRETLPAGFRAVGESTADYMMETPNCTYHLAVRMDSDPTEEIEITRDSSSCSKAVSPSCELGSHGAERGPASR